MEINEQLFRNYNELYYLLMFCYKDISILRAYEELQKKNNELYLATPNTSKHLIFLLQKDLALTLWKMYCDPDSNANTIQRFRNDVNKALRESGCSDKQAKSVKGNRAIIKKLNDMRNQFLAHTDMTRSDSRIEVSELKALLDVACGEFNTICGVIEDDRVNHAGVTEINKGWQEMCCCSELLGLYNRK